MPFEYCCTICSRSYLRRQRLATASYCSIACHAVGQRRTHHFICGQCGRGFIKRGVSKSYQPKFCGRHCQYLAMRKHETLACAHCRRVFDLTNRNRPAKYCSLTCAIEARVRPLADRFWEKVEKHRSGCWNWCAVLHGHGYGAIGVGRRIGGMRTAHRVA